MFNFWHSFRIKHVLFCLRVQKIVTFISETVNFICEWGYEDYCIVNPFRATNEIYLCEIKISP
jgi:hypothetical protein